MIEDVYKRQIANEMDTLRKLDISKENIEEKLSEIYDGDKLEQISAATTILAFFLEGHFSDE